MKPQGHPEGRQSGHRPEGSGVQFLLATAQQLLDRPDAKTAGLWPRAAALLARQALEQSLDAFWKAKGLALAALPMRPQLLCLPRYLDDAPLAASLSHTWTALTHACHHHPYELPPTTGELVQWIALTRRFTEGAG
jgi:hypothetical protein